MKRRLLHLSAAILLAMAGSTPAMASEKTVHGISLTGTPKYKQGFTHFDYANPHAPKGGTLRRGLVGTFDSLNAFAIKGRSAGGIGLIYDTLLTPSHDEASSSYGLLARSMTLDANNAWATFHLRKKARFHDGTPITASDVKFSFEAMTQVSPFYKNYFKGIERVEVRDKHTVTFHFRPDQRSLEMPYIAGQLKVLPSHLMTTERLAKGSLDIPLGSGPYRIFSVDPGKRIVYERVKGYWGKDLPVNKGRYNYDTMVFEYYKDRTVSFEAFKAGHFDIQGESAGKNWYRGYTGKNVENGWIIKEEIPHQMPTGMRGIAMNIRKAPLNDRNVRMALTTLYDYEWINNAIYFGQLKRHNSYFSNSEFASSGLPQGEELKTLESIQELIAQDIFTTPFLLEKGDGSGMDRNRLKKAAGLFHKAGYTFKDGAMRDKAGNPLRLSILIGSKGLQKQLLPFRQSLAKLGITLNIRLLDSTHYVEKVRSKDFQMIITRYRQSLSPGNEQRNMWHSESADEKGSRNYIGLQDKAIDALVELVINAPDRKTLTARTKALDRLLLYGHYMIPLGYSDRYRIAIWDKFGRPETLPTHGLSLNAWWVDQEKEARLPDQLVSKTQK